MRKSSIRRSMSKPVKILTEAPQEYEELKRNHADSLSILSQSEQVLYKSMDKFVLDKASELSYLQKTRFDDENEEFYRDYISTIISTVLDAHEEIYDYLEQVESDIHAYVDNTNTESAHMREELILSTEDVYRDKKKVLTKFQKEVDGQKDELKGLKEKTTDLLSQIEKRSDNLATTMSYARPKCQNGYESIEAVIMSQIRGFPARYQKKISDENPNLAKYRADRQEIINEYRNYCIADISEVEDAISETKNQILELTKEYESQQKSIKHSEETLQHARWNRLSLEQQLLDMPINCSQNILRDLSKSRSENDFLREETIKLENLNELLNGDIHMLCEKHKSDKINMFTFFNNCKLLKTVLDEMSNYTDLTSNSLRKFDDPDIFFEDGTSPVIVNSGSFDALCYVLLHEGNFDPMYFKSLSVLILLSNKNPREVFSALFENLGFSDYLHKSDRIISFATQLSIWFPEWYQTDETLSVIESIMPDEIKKSLLFTYRKDLSINIRYVKLPETANFMTCEVKCYVNHLNALQIKLVNLIQPSELISSGWTKPSRDSVAPNVVKLTNHFNGLTNMALLSIRQCQSDDDKLKALKKWVLICEEARRQNNFLTVFALIGALSNPSLSKIREKLDSEGKGIYQQSEDLTSPLGKFRNYVRELSKVDVRKAIPFIGTFLTNLVFIDDGNPLVRRNPRSGVDVLSLSKCRLISEQIDGVVQGWGIDLKFYIDKRILSELDKSITAAAKENTEISK